MTEPSTETVTDVTNEEPAEVPEVEVEQGYVSPDIAAAQAGEVVVFEMSPVTEPEFEIEIEVDPHQHEGH